MKIKIFVLILAAGLISACGSQPTTQAAAPTQASVAATDAPALPTDTAAAAAPTEAPAATEAPATESVPAGATVSFANDIAPILSSRCVTCHGGDRTEEDLDLKSYSSMMAGSSNGPVIVPNDATNSLLVDLVQSNKMPKRGPKLTPSQVQLIVDWINQGAQNN